MKHVVPFTVVAGAGTFDFTPAFEDAILRILPSGLFLVVALQRLSWLARQPPKVAKSYRPIVKVASVKLRLGPRNLESSPGSLCQRGRQLLTSPVVTDIDKRLHSPTICSFAVLYSKHREVAFLSTANVSCSARLHRWILAFVPLSRRACAYGAAIDCYQRLLALHSAL
jgi:hypothetical protein